MHHDMDMVVQPAAEYSRRMRVLDYDSKNYDMAGVDQQQLALVGWLVFISLRTFKREDDPIK